KGVREPVTLYRVVRPSGVRTRLAIAAGRLTPFVGREAERATLVERWEQAREGAGQNVVVLGEAGVGKSRLVYHPSLACRWQYHFPAIKTTPRYVQTWPDVRTRPAHRCGSAGGDTAGEPFPATSFKRHPVRAIQHDHAPRSGSEGWEGVVCAAQWCARGSRARAHRRAL